MKTMHPVEEAIQQYAIDPAGCQPADRQHIAGCNHCLANTGLYTQLFSAVQQQPSPAFDFDLAALVLNQLPQRKTAGSPGFLVAGLLTAIAVAVPAWLFRKYLLTVFTGMLPMTIYLVVIIGVAIVIFQGVDMYRKYDKLLSAVNE